MTQKSEIKKIKESFPCGEIKKIYQINDYTIIIKFKPTKGIFPYLRAFDENYHESYYYCPATLFTDRPFSPPWRYKSYRKLLKELLDTNSIHF